MKISGNRILILILAGLLAASVLVNLWFAGVVLPEKESDLANLSQRYSDLEAVNSGHLAELAIASENLTRYSGEIVRYQGEVGNLSTQLNTTSGAYLGSASLDAPVIFKTVDSLNGAESDNETGGMITVTAEMRYGQGRILVETKPPLGLTFQETASNAVAAARKYTGKNISSEDVVFTVRAAKEPQSIDGPSAGALMGILAVSVLEKSPVNESVAITGSISSDGRIGSIGGLPDKAKAAKAAGKSLLLIPRENRYLTVVHISGSSRVSETVDAREFLEKQVGIRCEYIDTLADIPRYMT